MKLQRNKTYLLTALTVALFLCSSCSHNKEEQEQADVRLENKETTSYYDLTAAEKGDVALSERLDCVYKQAKEQEVSFSISGKVIDKINVSEGDEVKTGDVLAEVEKGDLDEKIAALQYQIERNKLLLSYNEINEENEEAQQIENYTYHTGQSGDDYIEKEKKLKEIQKSHRYTREDLSDEIALDEAQAAVLNKEKEDGMLRANMDGTIYSMKTGLVGTVCVKDQVIMTVIGGSDGMFETAEPEYASYIHEGDTFEVSVFSGTGKGDYVLTPYQMDTWGENQYFEVLDMSEGTSPEVGARGTLNLLLEEKKDVLRLPIATVHTAEGKPYVYTVSENGMREVRWVTTGLTGNDYVEITSGLSEGEKVILR